MSVLENKELELNKLLDNVDHTVRILLPGSLGVCKFICSQEFQVEGGAEWQAPFNLGASADFMSNIINTVRQMPLGGILSGTVMGKSQTKLQSLFLTQVNYVSTTDPSFSLQLYDVARYKGYDVRSQFSKLLAGVYPRASTAMTVYAPYNYGYEGGTPFNTVDLQLGRWFWGRNMVLTQVTGSFSKEKVTGGLPLYCNIQVTMKPWRLPTADDMLEWLGQSTLKAALNSLEKQQSSIAGDLWDLSGEIKEMITS